MPEPAEFLAISEGTFQTKVLDLLRRNGYWAYHVQNSRRDEPGFLDVTAIDRTMGHPRDRQRPFLIVWELKAEAGRVDKKRRWTKGKVPREQSSQHDWLTGWAWLASVVNALAWRPGWGPLLEVGLRRPRDFRRMQEVVGDIGTPTWEAMQRRHQV